MYSCSYLFFASSPTTEIEPLSLHDALPICLKALDRAQSNAAGLICRRLGELLGTAAEYSHLGQVERSEEHTSELQSRGHLVCRLPLEKKKQSSTPERADPRRPRQGASNQPH